ncbi:hypothetical protein FA09DRAFT_115262 [Tilletiopsis washingtonensis]|uniref:Uncharacterized protein n=1 Tax=Tilletiopsis washingtonensis TaxID=58919 RepID=A0A316ZGD9_9BASI|nr:hypothetical protein FA09DRAFT_115262 [Tilletiopsis washingtonensis]PWO00821.1 hypothetical protein FA09DRAFT_115262 [Tilletiopsis washingtonensis]
MPALRSPAVHGSSAVTDCAASSIAAMPRAALPLPQPHRRCAASLLPLYARCTRRGAGARGTARVELPRPSSHIRSRSAAAARKLENAAAAPCGGCAARTLRDARRAGRGGEMAPACGCSTSTQGRQAPFLCPLPRASSICAALLARRRTSFDAARCLLHAGAAEQRRHLQLHGTESSAGFALHAAARAVPPCSRRSVAWCRRRAELCCAAAPRARSPYLSCTAPRQSLAPQILVARRVAPSRIAQAQDRRSTIASAPRRASMPSAGRAATPESNTAVLCCWNAVLDA